MPNDIDLLVRTSRAVGGVHRSVGEIAVPVAVVERDLPMSEVEVLFRSPHLPCLAVLDPADGAVGMVSRARFADAQTGRLGYGRAVLARRPVGDVADWSPLVVDEATGVVESATRAMERSDETRYDDVLVRSGTWGAVATSDLVRALVAALSERSLHDPLTRLPGRELVLHTAREWARLLVGSRRRLLLVQADVIGFARVNARFGGAAGDALLRLLAQRLRAGAPEGAMVGRTGSDEFLVVVLLPNVPDDRAEVQVTAVLDGIGRALAPQTPDEPGVRTAVVVSTPGAADADALVQEAQRRMLVRRAEPVPVVAPL
ncbi:GGDEF domain-containing protein [Cellulomonas triticagri]|uniref:Diguanylate cyclase n=1 Tax=Cellulomonas triticagri TaxID=2483352 RepID=A0A3M2J188_9CELL|nr:diguanylate cyclase [Cellulomonas triticagri]RMI06564.1 diguanylate cyclase [Cellulomonas triticagri]